VKKGDRVVLYTDGLVENIESGREWSEAGTKLLDTMRASSKVPLDDLPAYLAKELAGDSKEDDILVLAFEV